MLALGLQTLLLMSAAYIFGAALGCWLRRQFFANAARVPVTFERRVEPLPELDADVIGARRFVQAGQAVAAPAAPAAAGAEDLQKICGIDAATEARLKALGVSRYADISAWRRAELEHFAQALAIARKRISRENWIEQAQILAAGGRTRYADRRARGETASAVPSAEQGERKRPTKAAAAAAPTGAAGRPPAAAPGAQVAKVKVGAAFAASTPQVSERAAFAREGLSPPADRVVSAAASAPPPQSAASAGAVSVKPPQPAAPAGRASVEAMRELVPARPVRPLPLPNAEDLRRIRGIDGELAERLSAAGVVRYQQIANWSAADVERFDLQLATAGAIARENWIEQAQILSKGGDTSFSRAFDRGLAAEASPPARGSPSTEAAPSQEERPPRPVLLGSLRSVRSEAYQNPEPGPEAAHRVGSHNRVVRSAPTQDLKRIRGIGVLIERRLNAMQIATYEQIANWTAEDIERVSRTLDFKGRIERENWVEQARILASGGATEFSRRVDRGDIETGRYRP
jgi:predicted flap endonuclease-1-like 5' DNA nuclease